MSSAGAVNPQHIRDEMATIKWFHFIDLGKGIRTPGKTENLLRVKRLRMPAQLTGRTVLDVGAWDGFYSFEAEQEEPGGSLQRTTSVGSDKLVRAQRIGIARHASCSWIPTRRNRFPSRS
jgi:hypothetical protein